MFFGLKNLAYVLCAVLCMELCSAVGNQADAVFSGSPEAIQSGQILLAQMVKLICLSDELDEHGEPKKTVIEVSKNFFDACATLVDEQTSLEGADRLIETSGQFDEHEVACLYIDCPVVPLLAPVIQALAHIVDDSDSAHALMYVEGMDDALRDQLIHAADFLGLGVEEGKQLYRFYGKQIDVYKAEHGDVWPFIEEKFGRFDGVRLCVLNYCLSKEDCRIKLVAQTYSEIKQLILLPGRKSFLLKVQNQWVDETINIIFYDIETGVQAEWPIYTGDVWGIIPVYWFPDGSYFFARNRSDAEWCIWHKSEAPCTHTVTRFFGLTEGRVHFVRLVSNHMCLITMADSTKLLGNVDAKTVCLCKGTVINRLCTRDYVIDYNGDSVLPGVWLKDDLVNGLPFVYSDRRPVFVPGDETVSGRIEPGSFALGGSFFLLRVKKGVDSQYFYARIVQDGDTRVVVVRPLVLSFDQPVQYVKGTYWENFNFSPDKCSFVLRRVLAPNSGYVWHVDDIDRPQLLAGYAGNLTYFVWSPDSRYFVGVTRTGCYLWRRDHPDKGCAVVGVLKSLLDQPKTVQWSSDSKYFALHTFDERIYIVCRDAPERALPLLYEGIPARFGEFAWSPDGLWIAGTKINNIRWDYGVLCVWQRTMVDFAQVAMIGDCYGLAFCSGSGPIYWLAGGASLMTLQVGRSAVIMWTVFRNPIDLERKLQAEHHKKLTHSAAAILLKAHARRALCMRAVRGQKSMVARMLGRARMLFNMIVKWSE